MIGEEIEYIEWDQLSLLERFRIAIEMGWEIETEKKDNKLIFTFKLPVKDKKMVHAKLSEIDFLEARKK